MIWVMFSLCLLFVGGRNLSNSAFSMIEILHVIGNFFSLLMLNPFALSEVLKKIPKTFNTVQDMLKVFSRAFRCLIPDYSDSIVKQNLSMVQENRCFN